MALAAGTRLGPYEVVSLLGTGGMGEVYRASDARLHRDVALKVLPGHVADDPERLLRFEREARALAALNHPNIAQIYGVEESGTLRALAMELVGGSTLAERVARGPLAPDEACAIAQQIADALEAAHEAGIVHRDLKPANVKVTAAGVVKVLDFGLAKTNESAHSDLVASAAPTIAGISERGFASAPGTLLGTPAYMAPEQVRGQAVDRRADIWAFGCVLFELLSGRRLFGGATVSDTVAAVLTSDVSLRDLPSSVPTRVCHLLDRCLDRNPRTRLRDIGEARVVLAGTDTTVSRADAPRSRTPRGRLIAVIAGLIGLAAGVAIGWMGSARPLPRSQTYRFQVPTPSMLDLTDFAVSPDGRALAFVALAENEVPAVWIRPFDSADAHVLGGTEGAHSVFWSPDAREVGYVSGRQLYRRALNGPRSNAVVPVSGEFVGAAWARDAIVFASFPSGLMRVSPNGGGASPLTRLRDGDSLHGRPVFLADERHLLFVAYTAGGSQTCRVSLDDPALRCVDRDRVPVGVLEDGLLLSIRGGTLLADPFDSDSMASLGDPSPAIPESLPLRAAGNRPAVSYSRSAVIAFRSGSAQQRRLAWYDRGGRRGAVVATGSHDNFDLGPDGTRILAAGTDATGNDIVSLIDATRGVVSRIVAGERGWANDPVWSPDGREFAYLQRSDRSRIMVRPVNGGDARTVYEPPDEDAWVEDWSPDGRYLAVGTTQGWRHPRVLLVPVSGGEPRLIPADGTFVDEYQFSPDGTWLAYNSDASGRHEIYVTPIPPTGERWQVSSDGGVQARWRGDGRELFYLGPGNALMAVSVEEGRTFRASAPRRLFTVPEGLGSPILDEYAVTADGTSFLVAEPVHAAGVQPISVIVNWSARVR